MKDRIYQIMQKEGLTNADFAEKVGISTSSLSHIFSGRNNPSLDVVMRIHKAYPCINLNWLLYGEGEMEENQPAISAVSIVGQKSENAEFADNRPTESDFGRETGSGNHVFPPKSTEIERIKYIEKPQPKITEIRIFFDNGTFEVFKPEK